MTNLKDSKAIFLLKREWDIYKKNNSITQSEVSKKLGWSSSFFGSILRGSSPLGVENQIKIANLFGIDVLTLNPNCPTPHYISIPLHRTTSGKPAPANCKLTPLYDPHRVYIWSDEAVLVTAGDGYDRKHNHFPDGIFSVNKQVVANAVVAIVPVGVTLVCTKTDYPASIDPKFQNDDLPSWVVFQEGKAVKIVVSRKKPTLRIGRQVIAESSSDFADGKKEVLRLLGYLVL